MSWKVYGVLCLLGLLVALVVGSFQSIPGYMDADYYFAGGIQLVEGRGFNEPYIWNYLDEPTGVPHPSHSYWMPLASILAAVGMWLTGDNQYESGRLAFIALAALVPPITARLALTFEKRAFPALISGLLAVFSVYYVPFLPVTDNYGIYLVLGALFMLTVDGGRPWTSAIAGMLAGGMTLARSDGVLWLGLGIAAILARAMAPRNSITLEQLDRTAAIRSRREMWLRLAATAAGFLVVVTPWAVRNLQAYSALRAPGADRLLWITTYDEIFTYPPENLTPERWWGQGLGVMTAARLAALRWNLLNAVAAQGGLFLLPFIVIGAWQHRHDLRVQLGVAGWLVLLTAMTLALPAVGSRGGWFHAGAGLQVIWWCLAPLGLDRVVRAASERGLFDARAHVVFGVAMACIAAVMTGYILWIRVVPGWGEDEQAYANVDRRLVTAGAKPEDVVMVRNPPGYYVITGRSAVVVPYADPAGIHLAAERYGADYLVIEEAGASGPIREVYDAVDSEFFEFIGEEHATRLFRVIR